MKTVPIIMYLNGVSVVDLPAATFTFHAGDDKCPPIVAKIHSVICRGSGYDFELLEHVAMVGSIEVPDDAPDVVRLPYPHDTVPVIRTDTKEKCVPQLTPVNAAEEPK